MLIVAKNICKGPNVESNVDDAFTRADVVVEEEFLFSEEHTWNETEGAVSRMGEEKGHNLCSQSKSFADRINYSILNMDVDKIEVVHMPAGDWINRAYTHAYTIASLKTGR